MLEKFRANVLKVVHCSIAYFDVKTFPVLLFIKAFPVPHQ